MGVVYQARFDDDLPGWHAAQADVYAMERILVDVLGVNGSD